MKKLTAVLLLSVLYFYSNLSAQEKFDLVYKFEKGKTYFFQQKSIIDMTMSMMGQEINMSMDTKMKLKYEVLERNDNTIEVITSIDSMLAKTTNPMQGGETETKGEGIVGKKTKIIMDKYGKVIKKIEIDSTILTKMNLDFSTSNENMFQLSSKPVAIGESWKNIDTMKMNMGNAGTGGMEIIITTELKLEGKEKFENVECLKISMTQKQAAHGAIAAEGSGIGIEGSTVAKGVCYFDYKNGIMLSLALNGEGSMTMNMTEQGLSMPMSQKIQSSVKLVR